MQKNVFDAYFEGNRVTSLKGGPQGIALWTQSNFIVGSSFHLKVEVWVLESIQTDFYSD